MLFRILSSNFRISAKFYLTLTSWKHKYG